MMYLSSKCPFSSFFSLFLLKNPLTIDELSNCHRNTTYQSLLRLSALSLLWCSKFPNPVGCQHPERRNLCSEGAEGGSPVSWGLALHSGLHCNPLQREVWEHLLNWGARVGTRTTQEQLPGQCPPLHLSELLSWSCSSALLHPGMARDTGGLVGSCQK